VWHSLTTENFTPGVATITDNSALATPPLTSFLLVYLLLLVTHTHTLTHTHTHTDSLRLRLRLRLTFTFTLHVSYDTFFFLTFDIYFV
jgi:hypothetical protein